MRIGRDRLSDSSFYGRHPGMLGRTGASPAAYDLLIVNNTLVTFGVNPPSAAPLKASSGAYCTCSSAAYSLASAPPEYSHIAYRVLFGRFKPGSVSASESTARTESSVAWPDMTPAVKLASGPS